MSYRVILSSAARRALVQALPQAAAVACAELLAGPLATNPRTVGKPLQAPFEGHWVARRGEYRVRYRIDESERTIVVVAIRHRRDAYRS